MKRIRSLILKFILFNATGTWLMIYFYPALNFYYKSKSGLVHRMETVDHEAEAPKSAVTNRYVILPRDVLCFIFHPPTCPAFLYKAE